MRRHIDKIGFGIGYSGAVLSALNMLFFNKNAGLCWAVMAICTVGIVLVCISWVDRNPNEKKKT
jgi:hypothetical protein